MIVLMRQHGCNKFSTVVANLICRQTFFVFIWLAQPSQKVQGLLKLSQVKL